MGISQEQALINSIFGLNKNRDGFEDFLMPKTYRYEYIFWKLGVPVMPYYPRSRGSSYFDDQSAAEYFIEYGGRANCYNPLSVSNR
jgi:hypothetical protein